MIFGRTGGCLIALGYEFQWEWKVVGSKLYVRDFDRLCFVHMFIVIFSVDASHLLINSKRRGAMQ